mgnify:CR=1 FL=1
MRHLEKSYVDAIAGHEAMLGSLVKEGKDAYRMLDESIYKSELGVAFKKGNARGKLQQILQKHLKKLQREGITEKTSYKIWIGMRTKFCRKENKIE